MWQTLKKLTSFHVVSIILALNRVVDSEAILGQFRRNPDEFLRRYITVDEKWIQNFFPGQMWMFLFNFVLQLIQKFSLVLSVGCSTFCKVIDQNCSTSVPKNCRHFFSCRGPLPSSELVRAP